MLTLVSSRLVSADFCRLRPNRKLGQRNSVDEKRPTRGCARLGAGQWSAWKSSAGSFSPTPFRACRVGANLPPEVAILVGENMILLVGFDSAWTACNSGAIAGLLLPRGGAFREIGPPQVVNYAEAEQLTLDWQRQFRPDRTLVLLDQPTIVTNSTGQRPVEGIVSPWSASASAECSPPASRALKCSDPLRPLGLPPLLRRCSRPAPHHRWHQVIETYPVLALIALRWLQNRRGVWHTAKIQSSADKNVLVGRLEICL